MRLHRLVQRFLDCVPAGLILTDPAGRCQLVNRHFSQLTGLSVSDAAGDGWMQVIRQDFRIDFEQTWREARAAKDSIYVELEITGEGGALKWLSMRAAPVMLPGFRGWNLVALADITSSRREHEELSRSKRFLDSIVDQIPAMVFVKDAETLKFVRFSRAGEEITGFRESDLLGKSDRDFFPPDQADFFIEKDRQVLNSRSLSIIEEEPIQTAHRGLRFLRTKKLALCDDDGEPAYLLGISEDITDLRDARRAHFESDSLFRLMTEAASLLFWRSGPDKECIYFNRNWLEFTGRTIEQELGLGWLEGVHKEDVERCTRVHMENFDTRTEFSLEYRLRSANGDYRWIVDRGSPLYGTDGVFLGYVGFCYDVTERKESVAELRRARDAAERAADAKSQFLAHMSHEIRTPLNCVIGMTDLILESTLDYEQRDQLEKVKTAADALLSIVNDVLDISKIDAGRLALQMRPLSVSRVLEEVAGLLKISYSQKEVSLSIDCHAVGLRATRADDSGLRQVLLNLLDNARKFTPARGSVSVTVRPSPVAKDMLEWNVTDTGIGIPADKAASIFEPFMQADSTTSKVYGGTGLGLTIATHLVRAMGGELSVRSEPGKGSSFVFTTVDAGQVSESELPSAASPEGLLPVSGLRVLLVEDNQVNRTLATKILQKAGCEVVTAENGYDALRHADDQRFDVILMDIQMPGLDGYETTRRLRERESASGSRVPIIALTAYALPDDRERCLDCGMDDYLSKPFRRSELFTVITRVCSRPL